MLSPDRSWITASIHFVSKFLLFPRKTLVSTVVSVIDFRSFLDPLVVFVGHLSQRRNSWWGLLVSALNGTECTEHFGSNCSFRKTNRISEYGWQTNFDRKYTLQIEENATLRLYFSKPHKIWKQRWQSNRAFLEMSKYLYHLTKQVIPRSKANRKLPKSFWIIIV